MKYLESFGDYYSPPETRLNIFKGFHKDTFQMGAMDDNIKKSAEEITRIETEEEPSVDGISDLVAAAAIDNDLETWEPLVEPEDDNRLVINKPNGGIRKTGTFPYGMSGKGDDVLPEV